MSNEWLEPVHDAEYSKLRLFIDMGRSLVPALELAPGGRWD